MLPIICSLIQICLFLYYNSLYINYIFLISCILTIKYLMINYIITFFVVKYLTNYVWTIWKQDLNKKSNNKIVFYIFITLFKPDISLESGIYLLFEFMKIH